MIYPQLLLDLHDELIVDLFAGGGGASCGIEMALGRQVDYAINHDGAAVSMHEANHPQTRHYVSDVFEVDPRDVVKGRKVGFLWASPDCTHHSKARGGKPLRDAARRRRALAWVVTRWAGTVRPRVIMLENVEEFRQWGPLVGPKDHLQPDPKRKGRTFRRWVRSLETLGYQVEWRELRACDFGAPTIRKRLFIIARCDGQPIVWPEPSHGPGRRPYRTAAECIDWSIPCPSIFERERPLAENTLRRIARGVMRYVVDNPRPFIVPLTHHGAPRFYGMEDRLPTITGAKRGELAMVSPFITEHANASNQRNMDAAEPLRTQAAQVKGGHFALVASFLAQHNNGFAIDNAGRSAQTPLSTITGRGTQQNVVAASLVKLRGTSTDSDAGEPLHTISAGGTHHGLVAAHLTHNYTSNTNGGQGDPTEPIKTLTTGNHAGLVYAFLQTYYGQGIGQLPSEPMRTVPTVDRFGLVTVLNGEYFISDIGMRMLQPRELYRAQGFPDSYIIDRGADGRTLSKTEQVRMVGNSVCPPIAAALVRANVPEMISRTQKEIKRTEAVAA